MNERSERIINTSPKAHRCRIAPARVGGPSGNMGHR